MHTFKTPSKRLSIGPAAKYLGVSRDTLRRWEKRGKLRPLRTPTNRRLYTQDQLDRLLSDKPQPSTYQTLSSKQRHTIIILTLLITLILAYLAQFFTR